jgi:hypothetical protein
VATLIALSFIPRSFEEQVFDDFPLDVIQHFSATQAKMAARCLEQFRHRYILHEKERPGAAMFWGSSHHDALEYNFAKKIASHEDIPTTEVKEVFANDLDRRIDEAGLTEIDWGSQYGGVLTKGDAKIAHADVKDRGTSLVGCHHEALAPELQPTSIEEEFHIEIPGVPIDLMGYIDITGERLGIEKIIEVKTSGGYSMADDWAIQGGIYQLYKPVPIDYDVALKKTKSPSTKTFAGEDGKGFLPAPPEAMQAWLRGLIATVSMMFKTYGPDEPWPGTGRGAIFGDSSCAFCGFKPHCTYWR